MAATLIPIDIFQLTKLSFHAAACVCVKVLPCTNVQGWSAGVKISWNLLGSLIGSIYERWMSWIIYTVLLLLTHTHKSHSSTEIPCIDMEWNERITSLCQQLRGSLFNTLEKIFGKHSCVACVDQDTNRERENKMLIKLCVEVLFVCWVSGLLSKFPLCLIERN